MVLENSRTIRANELKDFGEQTNYKAQSKATQSPTTLQVFICMRTHTPHQGNLYLQYMERPL